MGWASWNCFKTDITEEKMKEQARALISTGLAQCGYTYLNMDDGFFGGRDQKGCLQFHTQRFPQGIKVVADYAHSLGLKAGIYSDAGDNTCGHYYNGEGKNGEGAGLYLHEEQDLKMYLEDFGFDFIKVDWCGGVRLGLDEEEQYSKIGRIIDNIRNRTGRTLVYNICRWQFPGAWAAKVADSWRTGADIAPEFNSVLHQLDVIKPLARYCSPGHVNDLDMMQIGNGMELEDEKTHFAMWCMMSTPLMIGGDLTKISDQTLSILKNTELIQINQDPACLQAYVIQEGKDEENSITWEVYLKDLGEKNSCEKALAFLNRSDKAQQIELPLEKAGLKGTILSIRNVCERKDEPCQEKLNVSLLPHQTQVYRICATKAEAVPNKDDVGEWAPLPLKKISLEEVPLLMAQGAQLVDVRSKEEYDAGHLEGAIHIYYADVHSISSWYLTKDKPVILYCATGKRSSQATRSLDYLGYSTYYLGGVEI